MKTRHLFTVALAAFAFAACSQDDDINTNPEPQPGEKGALVEGISINFGESETAHTRAYSGSQTGEGTEGMIYEAFIFAKEANPTHARPLDGDWTVLRVTADQTSGAIVVETGGVDAEKTAKSALTKAINEDSKKELEWLVKDVASFKGVRQGDYVYVIANDPSLTLAQASAMAHNGDKSEDDIKGYVASINKDYLNKLTYAGDVRDADNKKAEPKGKFVMAGREMIPVSPNIPANGDFSMTIGLDRELSKVSFTASISTNDADVAKGKVAFLEDDGIVVARIARKVSPFAEQTPDWYVPADNCVEDWPINSHALVNNKYTAFCDGTREGSFVFDGASATPITDWNTGVSIAAGFNGVAPAASVTEYRYSWKLKSGAELTDNKNLVYLSQKTDGTLCAPIFYTTPNYSNNTNSVTVICTQATYVDRGVFSLTDMADKYVDAALAATDADIQLFTADEVKKLDADADADLLANGVKVPNFLKKHINDGSTWNNDDDITDAIKDAIKLFGVRMVDKTTYEAATLTSTALNGVSYDDYVKDMNRFYVAVMLQQKMDYKKAIKGTYTADTDESTWGNGIPSEVTEAYMAGATATDSLLLGYKMIGATDKVRVSKPFYITLTKSNDDLLQVFKEIFAAAKNTPAVETSGCETRPFFETADAYEYFKGQKLYYRADVANYVGGASSKITERNMYYVTKGTILSLGAKSIHDAIYADQNTMHIDVKVNDWKLSINEAPM